MDKKTMVAELREMGIEVDGRTSEAKVTEIYEQATASKEEITMSNKAERANRVTVQTVADGQYEARFYRTHRPLATVNSVETGWMADPKANSTTNRESFRNYVIEHADEVGVLWQPAKQVQAWERKHNSYLTDEQVAEDALTLVTPALERLAEKSRYDMWITSDIEVTAITPKESNLTYVEDGRYTKSGAWCVADIELELDVVVSDKKMQMVYHMEMKSGQICKPKTTIAEWNEMVAREMELNGIEDTADKDAEQTA